MKIIKEGKLKATQESLEFFKKHFNSIGEVKYIVLYYAEKEWSINPNIYHQYVIIIGEYAQLWMSGLTWGYNGAGPTGLREIMNMIDPEITCKQIRDLEWMADHPIVFENMNGRLTLKPFNETVHSLLCVQDNRLPWSIKSNYELFGLQDV